MKTLCFTVLIGMLSGCATDPPSGHWEQTGRTELETQDDLDHCDKVAFLDSQRNKTDEPFKAALVEQNCMERMGYTYVKHSKNAPSFEAAPGYEDSAYWWRHEQRGASGNAR